MKKKSVKKHPDAAQDKKLIEKTIRKDIKKSARKKA